MAAAAAAAGAGVAEVGVAPPCAAPTTTTPVPWPTPPPPPPPAVPASGADDVDMETASTGTAEEVVMQSGHVIPARFLTAEEHAEEQRVAKARQKRFEEDGKGTGSHLADPEGLLGAH